MLLLFNSQQTGYAVAAVAAVAALNIRDEVVIVDSDATAGAVVEVLDMRLIVTVAAAAAVAATVACCLSLFLLLLFTTANLDGLMVSLC